MLCVAGKGRIAVLVVPGDSISHDELGRTVVVGEEKATVQNQTGDGCLLFPRTVLMQEMPTLGYCSDAVFLRSCTS